MNRWVAWVAAEFISIVHMGQILVALFGWLFPDPYYFIYLAIISLALISQFVFHDCFLTKWEFYFRKKINPSIGKTPYYLTYYTHKFFPGAVSDDFIDRISLIFLSVSILAAALRLSGNF